MVLVAGGEAVVAVEPGTDASDMLQASAEPMYIRFCGVSKDVVNRFVEMKRWAIHPARKVRGSIGIDGGRGSNGGERFGQPGTVYV
jgi:hypothetical protein